MLSFTPQTSPETGRTGVISSTLPSRKVITGPKPCRQGTAEPRLDSFWCFWLNIYSLGGYLHKRLLTTRFVSASGAFWATVPPYLVQRERKAGCCYNLCILCEGGRLGTFMEKKFKETTLYVSFTMKFFFFFGKKWKLSQKGLLLPS